MIDQATLVFSKVVELYSEQVYAWIALGVLFTGLSIFKTQACNPGKNVVDKPRAKNRYFLRPRR